MESFLIPSPRAVAVCWQVQSKRQWCHMSITLVPAQPGPGDMQEASWASLHTWGLHWPES